MTASQPDNHAPQPGQDADPGKSLSEPVWITATVIIVAAITALTLML